ncbi:hypothetical protein DFA_05058 [Cavenderia fasciculata]|uniref:Paramecium surface antigen repeat-containing protein n=1 Tax=Cavenderia fasciculata TaxID=261658 RepID=F4PN75_CACFS|nr:uncharacterized protein DFA_05058 [Cavenderia fasciculata]EGG22928.1 hypothetical protein DFA_05058 [Cavenderia fasciculata]|eukprot:XP_004360779.1 hypothetical protein DFA_05058 [Cavenderia fasciculata]
MFNSHRNNIGFYFHLIILSIFLLFISRSTTQGQPSSCTQYQIGQTQCQREAESCTENSDCMYGTYCKTFDDEHGTSRCVRISNFNGYCSGLDAGTLECGTLYSCIDHKCVREKYIEVDQPCEESYECMGTLLCTDGTCQSNNNTCNETSLDQDCPFTHSCVQGTCVKRAMLGGECSDKKAGCPLGTLCFNFTCHELFTLKEGEDCISSGFMDLCDYEMGFYCNPKSKCAKIPRPSPMGANCTAQNTNTNTSTTTTTCNQFEECFCDHGSNNNNNINNNSSSYGGTCYPKRISTIDKLGTCKRAISSMFDCANENQCVFSDVPRMGSCLQEKCSVEMCAYYLDCTDYTNPVTISRDCVLPMYQEYCPNYFTGVIDSNASHLTCIASTKLLSSSSIMFKSTFSSLALIFIVVVTLNLGVSFTDGKCSTYYPNTDECASAGEVCNSTVRCNPDFYCQDGSCLKYANLGEDCPLGTECNAVYSCQNGVCLHSKTQQLGENCTGTYQCLGSLVCQNDVCSLNNGTCVSYMDCLYNQTCISGVCVTKTTGDECTRTNSYTNLDCAFGSSCVDGVCTKYYSLGLGDACYKSAFLDTCDYSQGLTCDPKLSVCVAQPQLTNSSVNCMTAGCQVNEVCYCDNGVSNTTGQCYGTFANNRSMELCGSYAISFVQCMIQNECVFTPQTIPGSCMIDNCGQPLCGFTEYCVNKQPTATPVNPTCTAKMGYTCFKGDDSSSSAVIGQQSSIMVTLFVAIIFTIFF